MAISEAKAQKKKERLEKESRTKMANFRLPLDIHIMLAELSKKFDVPKIFVVIVAIQEIYKREIG